jgi:phosphatidylserine/phosphatidylglycerophosphate/cardiolipin synthase-like enzyme
MHGKRGGIILGLLLVLALAMAGYDMNRPLPSGIGTTTPWRPAGTIRFLADETWVDATGTRHTEQAIIDEELRLIAQAQQLVVLDQFLFNPFAGAAGSPHRAITEELTRALIARREAVPDLRVVFITDPFNTLYGGVENPFIDQLKDAGIRVILTDLNQLHDPNPAWSVIWRACCRWAGNSSNGWLPSPVGSEPITVRTYMALLNFKANHRKTLVADYGDSWAGVVSSANPHSASSAHDNAGLYFEGPAALDLLQTEADVVAFSHKRPDWPASADARPDALPRMRILTEAAIRDAVLATLKRARAGDEIDLLMFYLSHRDVMAALKEARQRGARIRVLLDPNKDAFGRNKSGIPNRPAAHELHDAGIDVRWCDTHGEQCHSKMLLYRPETGPARMILGSANFTRRNLDNFNLETNVDVEADPTSELVSNATQSFERQWHNQDGRHYSVAYPVYADESPWQYWLYRFTEATGLSSF